MKISNIWQAWQTTLLGLALACICSHIIATDTGRLTQDNIFYSSFLFIILALTDFANEGSNARK